MTGKIAKSVTGKIHFWPIYHFNKFVFDLFICNLFPPNDLFASRSPTFHTEKIEQLHLFLLQWQGWVKRRVSVIAGSQQMTSPGREGHWLPPSLELPWQTQERNCPTQRWALCHDYLLLCFPLFPTTFFRNLDTWRSKIQWYI